MPKHYGKSAMPNSPRKKTPKGFHRMPNGMFMKGESHNSKSSPKATKIKLGGKEIEMKPNALRKQLKVPDGKKIPMGLLKKIIDAEVGDEMSNPFGGKIKVTALLKKRASLGRTLKRLN